MRTIKINILSEESIDKAISDLQKYSSNLRNKIWKAQKELTQIGAKVVDDNYAKTHDEDYVVYFITEENECAIIALGDSVMFLEFGTGVYTEDFSDEMDHGPLPPIYGGSWSQSEGMGHFRPGHEYWYYNRIKYQGTLPTHGFYFATKEMKDRAEEVVRKVFAK